MHFTVSTCVLHHVSVLHTFNILCLTCVISSHCIASHCTSVCLVSLHDLSHYVCHLMSPDLMSFECQFHTCCFIQRYVICLLQFVSSRFILCYIISCQFTWRRFVSRLFALFHLVSLYVSPCNSVQCYFTLFGSVSFRVMASHIISHDLFWFRASSVQLVLLNVYDVVFDCIGGYFIMHHHVHVVSIRVNSSSWFKVCSFNSMWFLWTTSFQFIRLDMTQYHVISLHATLVQFVSHYVIDFISFNVYSPTIVLVNVVHIYFMWVRSISCNFVLLHVC